MLMSFLGTIVIGFGAAGTWMLVTKVLRLGAPRWAIPVVAGTAMLAFQLYIEYSWLQRTAGALPARVVVAEHGTYRHVLQPWTLIVPQVNRFTAVDTGRIRTNPALPGYVWAEVVFVTRYYPTMASQQLYDCTQPRRADILPSMNVGADGLAADLVWIALEADDPVRAVACAAGEERRTGGWQSTASRLR